MYILLAEIFLCYIKAHSQLYIRNSSERIQLKSVQMDLQWLLPEQIEQILKFCELSSVEDLTVAANILENNHWDLQHALHDVVSQNDEIHRQEQRKIITSNKVATKKTETKNFIHPYQMNDDQYEMAPQDYHQLINQDNNHTKPELGHHSSILAQQNFEYEEMGRKMIQQKEQASLKEALNKKNEELTKQKEETYAVERKEFQNRKVSDPLSIKFRLTHGTAQYTFSHKDKAETVIKYVNCFLRDNFDNRYAEFDLTQNFPPISLKNQKNKLLSQIFGESVGQVLIVKELD